MAERAAVVGRTFERGAVQALSPDADRAGLTEHLLGLVRKELVRPYAALGIDGDDAYRFRHLLIRDAAYGALPKAERAELHDRFADWLARTAGERLPEYEEIVAHHLGESYRYRVVLGQTGAQTDAVGQRAAGHFISAARRAETRGDLPGAAELYRQVLRLPTSFEIRAHAQLQDAMILMEIGDWVPAEEALTAAEQLVAREGAGVWRAHADVLRGRYRFYQDAPVPNDEIEQIAGGALRRFETAGDELGQARAWDLLAFSRFHRGDWQAAGPAWRTADEHASRVDAPAEKARILALLPGTATYGLEPISRGIAYCEGLMRRSTQPVFRARVTAILAHMHAQRGDDADARALLAESRSLLGELGVAWLSAETPFIYSDTAILYGDWPQAEVDARAGLEAARTHRFEQFRGMGLVQLAEPLFRQGKLDELRNVMAELDGALADSPVVDPYFRGHQKLWHARIAAMDGAPARARHLLQRFEYEDLEALTPLSGGAWDLLRVRAETLGVLGDWTAAERSLRQAEHHLEQIEAWAQLKSIRRMLDQVARRRVPLPFADAAMDVS